MNLDTRLTLIEMKALLLLGVSFILLSYGLGWL